MIFSKKGNKMFPFFIYICYTLVKEVIYMNKNFICASKVACTFENHVPAPYLRRTFTLSGKIESASITVTATGFYILYVNGKNITKGILAPYISNPDHYLYSDSYDIAPYLNAGDNVVGLILGNGFGNSFGGFVWDFDKAEFLAPPAVALECNIKTDSGCIYFEADDSFKTHPSPILFDDERHGEIYDAVKEIECWNKADFDDSDWDAPFTARVPKGEIRPCMCEPIVKIREIKPVSITKENDGYLYDFGINTAGLVRMDIDAQAGQLIYARFGEALKNGQFYDNNVGFGGEHRAIYSEYGQQFRYTAKAGRQSYTPHFCYYGYRYAFVTGITEEQATEDLLTMLVCNSDLKKLANFECSDMRTNKLFEMAINSDLSNFYYFPTDCPHREKNGWTGDASISADRMTTFYSVDKSYVQWLDNIIKAQNDEGALPGIVPTGGWGFKWGNGPAWDCVLFNLPYQLFKQRGNTAAIHQCKDAQIKYLKYIMTRRSADGTIGIGLSDWAAADKRSGEIAHLNRFTDSVIIMDAARIANEMYSACGFTDDAEFASSIYREMKATIRRELIDKDTLTAWGECMACQAMGLYYGIFEKDEEKTAFARLLEFIHANNDRFDTGFLGQHCMYHVLTKFGESELAYKMITAPNGISFGDLYDKGYTSVTEHFFSDPERFSSLNHHFQSEYARWFITAVAGIEIIDSNTVRVNPQFISSLEWVKAHVTLPAGKVCIEWRKKDGRAEVRLSAPEGITII